MAHPLADLTPPLLTAENVCKSFGDGAKRILVLQEIDLTIPEGEIVCILGPSGSGKSTLLRILAGLSQPSSGTVRFRGNPQAGPNPEIAIVFQTFALFPWLTVYDNVEVGLLNTETPETRRRRQILEAIDLIGLDGFEDAYPKELSGGMRQRVGFARALVTEPTLLFMDEPFSALDVLTAENLKKELLSLWQGKKIPTRSIVVVTHNIDEAVFLGDRVVVMGHDPGIVRVDMPGLPLLEREKNHPERARMVDYIYDVITNPAGDVVPFRREAPAVRPQPATRAYQTLPHVSVGQVTGLVERIQADGGRADLFALGRELHMEVDDLLPLAQAIDMLGLGDIEKGDVFLSPAGVRFAEAGVLEEKDVFREQAEANIVLIQQILKDLDAAPRGEAPWREVLATLIGCFSPDEAERQLETATNWGRYAELFAYDDGRQVFYREPKG